MSPICGIFSSLKVVYQEFMLEPIANCLSVIFVICFFPLYQPEQTLILCHVACQGIIYSARKKANFIEVDCIKVDRIP